MTQGRVLLVGSWDHPELLNACRWLFEQADVRRCRTFAQAQELVASEPFSPHLVVLAQARRDCFSRSEVYGLRRTAPLARFVALLGSWCEGELRTGSLLPGVFRIYWHQWSALLPAFLPGNQEADVRLRQLPPTATAVDVMLCTSTTRPTLCPGLAVIRAADVTTFETLADACQIQGLSATWLPPDRPLHVRDATVLLWDDTSLCEHKAVEIQAVWQRAGGPLLVMLLDYPRSDEVQRARATGAARVVSKPFLLTSLLAALAESIDLADSSASKRCAA